jgi:hypothetical protein
MPEPTSALLLQFLEWLSSQRRSYADAMDAWRTSCPRLTIWEDALSDGLIEVESRGSRQQSIVSLTARGRDVLSSRKT